MTTMRFTMGCLDGELDSDCSSSSRRVNEGGGQIRKLK